MSKHVGGASGAFDIDPWLQLVATTPNSLVTTVTRGLRGGGPLPQPGRASVDVLAELHDPNQGLPPQLSVPAHYQRGKKFVTGTVARDDIDRVRSHLNIKRLKLATLVRRQLNASVHAINGTQSDIQNCLGREVNGSGVIIGIVDDGCDFLHPNFRAVDSHGRPAGTRLLHLWDQTEPLGSAAHPPGEFAYGREFDSQAVNGAIAVGNGFGMEAAFDHLKYWPEEYAHGTHVMDIAAGNGSAPHCNNPGVAPKADLIFVQIPRLQIDQPTLVANARHVLDAIEYIFLRAGNRPCVVNVSLAAFSGPHDGTTLVEQGITDLLATPGRAVVIAAGNGCDPDLHRMKTIRPNETINIGWLVRPSDPTINVVEFWYKGTDSFAVTLRSPDGSITVGPVTPGNHKPVMIGQDLIGEVLHRAGDPGNHDNQVLIILAPTRMTPANLVASVAPPSGQWTILINNTGTGTATIHGWIERDDYRPDGIAQQSRFDQGSYDRNNDLKCTLGNFSCGGDRTIIVSAYNSATNTLLDVSSSGPTRGTGTEVPSKPDVCAPGESKNSMSPGRRGVMAASATERVPIRLPGTSMAAPHVSGLAALLFAAAKYPMNISAAQIRGLIVATAGHPGRWDEREGYGHIDVCAALKELVNKGW